MNGLRKHPLFRLAAALGVTLTLVAAAPPGWAASHREAPITALDHKADITDYFAFRSYDPAATSKVTFLLNVDPLLEPSNGPNWFPFDPEITYAIRVDNNHDAVEDIVITVKFTTEIRLPEVFTGLVGGIFGIPPITALDGPGSEGFSLRQHYSVTVQKRTGPTTFQTVLSTTTAANGKELIAVPTNVGPRTMPSYASLVEQGIFDLGAGIRVFAGAADDPFYIDLGAVFDSLNLRPSAFPSGTPGVLTPAQDAVDDRRFTPDDVSGFNVNVIAIEIPVDMLTSNGQVNAATSPAATIGSWGTTSRPRTKVQPSQPGGQPTLSANVTQIQRMGNALINELIIGTGFKDKWSMSQPKDDAQFADFFLDPLLAQILASLGIPVPPPPRNDLLPLVQYRPPIAAPGTPTGPIADLLRLNTGVAPTPLASQSRLGFLDGDTAGYPNGRRVIDDVTDISLRVVAGVLAGPPFDGPPNSLLGDGVNVNDVQPYRATFPYVQLAHSGRNSRHIDPTEPGCHRPTPPFAARNCPTN